MANVTQLTRGCTGFKPRLGPLFHDASGHTAPQTSRVQWAGVGPGRRWASGHPLTPPGGSLGYTHTEEATFQLRSEIWLGFLGEQPWSWGCSLPMPPGMALIENSAGHPHPRYQEVVCSVLWAFGPRSAMVNSKTPYCVRSTPTSVPAARSALTAGEELCVFQNTRPPRSTFLHQQLWGAFLPTRFPRVTFPSKQVSELHEAERQIYSIWIGVNNPVGWGSWAFSPRCWCSVWLGVVAMNLHCSVSREEDRRDQKGLRSSWDAAVCDAGGRLSDKATGLPARRESLKFGPPCSPYSPQDAQSKDQVRSFLLQGSAGGLGQGQLPCRS